MPPVYGWEFTEFEAVESNEVYLLNIGVTKGSLLLEQLVEFVSPDSANAISLQVFTIQHTGGTACK